MLAISNNLTIGSDFDLCSDKLLDKSIKAGHWNGQGDFSFKKNFATWFMPWAGRANKRQSCNRTRLAAILRQHKKDNSLSSNADVCMHATGVFRPSQTTQSMIFELSLKTNRSWMNGGSAPCISLFKPLHQAGNSWLLKNPKFCKQLA